MKKRFSLLVLIISIIVTAIVVSCISFGIAYRFASNKETNDSFLYDMEML